MLYYVLGTFFTFWLFWLFLFWGEGPPKYLNLATCCVSFFFFLKPSDRISLPLLAQIRFFWGVGEGVEQGAGEWDS